MVALVGPVLTRANAASSPVAIFRIFGIMNAFMSAALAATATREYRTLVATSRNSSAVPTEMPPVLAILPQPTLPAPERAPVNVKLALGAMAIEAKLPVIVLVGISSVTN